jgi:aspartate aminotransferase
MSEETQLTASLADIARQDLRAARASSMASGLVGSEILRIALEIRALKAAGKSICDLTVGDFDARHFPIPQALAAAVHAAYDRGETAYPPPTGVLELRKAVQRFYADELGLDYPLESVLITGGARPIIYSIYRALCDPGDRVVYPLPSWNNNHYVHMVGAEGVPVPCHAENRFLPSAADLAPVLAGARLLSLNSPLNPTGTAFTADALGAICELVLAENAGRERRGERPLFVMYDHIYWMLRFGGIEHVTPPGLYPEMARYTVFVDGLSKAFAATGLRVGWGLGPADVLERMAAIVGHVGAWAPRPEQLASAALLDNRPAIREFHAVFLKEVEARLERLHSGLQELKAEGLPVESIPPMGAIYLSARLYPFGRRRGPGPVLATNDDVRRFVLEAAGIGLVPFQAFGVPEDEGWFRLSVGAVSHRDIEEGLARLGQALRDLS